MSAFTQKLTTVQNDIKTPYVVFSVRLGQVSALGHISNKGFIIVHVGCIFLFSRICQY